MSDSPTPDKPKPGSLRDRIAAFEHKPPPSSAAPPAPRPKQANLSQWKPRAPSPPDSQPQTNRQDTSMSANDAKESITKAGSLKERMALLQGLGAFGGGQAAAPPPRPAEKPRWKPPPQVTLVPPVTGDDEKDDSVSTGEVDNKPVISPLKVPSDEIVAALSKQPPPTQEGSSEVEGERPTEAEEQVDPEEEERQRRAAIAARMARLGGTRVGMGPPIFGRKPEIKPKPAMPAPEATREEPSAADVPVAERDVEHAQAETDIAVNVPLPTSPPIDEIATGTLSPQSQNAGSEYFPQSSSPSVSPNIAQRAMPVPQGPRRAAPPRKKASSKPTPAETEAATPFLEKDTPIYDSPDLTSESQSAPIPASGHVEPEVGATDANADGSLPEPADEKNAPLPRPVSPPSEPSPSPLDTPEVDSKHRQDLPPPDDTIETAVPSSAGVPGVMQEGSEVEEVLAPEPGEDETAEAAAEEEDEGAFGGQPRHSPPGAIPVEEAGTALGSQHAPMDMPAVPYSVNQQGGGTNEADEEDEDAESDPRAQALLQHALEAKSLQASQDTIDDNDADTRVAHEVEVEQLTPAAESRQLLSKDDDREKYTPPEASSPPPSTVHSQYAANEFGAAPVNVESEPLTPALSADDFSDTEMAPPRVTRPLPAAPAPPPPGASDEPIIAQAQIPPPPAIPKRTSLPPPTRAVPSYQPDSPLLVQGYSPQRTPSGKRTSIPPPSRGTPVPTPEDVALQRRQSLTKRTSVPPPTRAVPSPSAPYSEPPVVPPPPPPPPLSFGYTEQEPEQAGEAPQVRDERIYSPPYTPVRKPSLPPPVPDGRRSVEARRNTEPRPGHEERRRSGQYAGSTPPSIPRLSSPPSKKRAPPSLLSEKEVPDDDTEDPVDPRFHTPTKSSMTVPTPPPTSPEFLSSAPPASTAGLRHDDDSEGGEELKRRRTIAERMAKLGAIKFGAPPPIHRVQPSALAVPAEGAGAEGSTEGSGQPASEEPEEQEEDEDEQTRRQRIAAKLAGMGGMRFGMLPVPPGMGVTLPSPPVPTRRPTIPPPPTQPAALPAESDQEYEHPSSSDDGVQVEAEESELEEVSHEDLEDEYDVETAEEEELTMPLPLQPPPPPAPPRSTRPPVPSGRPPVPPTTGRRPSAEVPSTPSPRSGSFDTVTSAARPPLPATTTRPPPPPTSSDFVMVEAEEAQPSAPARPLRGPPPPRSAPSAPPELSSDPPAPGSSSGQWELPSIPSSSLDFFGGDGGGAGAATGSDLSGTSRWSEDSTAYPAPLPASAPVPAPAPPPQPQLQLQPQRPHSIIGGQPRASSVSVPPVVAAAPARMTVDELRGVWERVGVYVAEAATGLLERSKRTLVGNGSYEGFVAEVLAQVPNASAPQAPDEYGFLVYAQTAAQVHARLADIMPGDVVVVQGARLKGHKGLQSYSMSAGEGSRPCVGVVSEFDAKKLKLRALQANRRVGQATVESVSYRLEDLKSGTIKVYRVLEV